MDGNLMHSKRNKHTPACRVDLKLDDHVLPPHTHPQRARTSAIKILNPLPARQTRQRPRPSWRGRMETSTSGAARGSDETTGDEGSSREPCRQCRFCLGNRVPQGVSDALRASANNCRPCWTFTDSAWNNAIAIARRFRRGKRRRKQAEQEQDPDYHAFITPCACKGSVRFVHKKCLQLWIVTNAQQPNSFACPICREKYSIPRNFMRDLDGKATLGGLRLAANTAQWYFSSCFLLGGIQGFRTMVGWRIMADRTWAS